MTKQELLQLLEQFLAAPDGPQAFLDLHPELLGKEADDILANLVDQNSELRGELEKVRRMLGLFRQARGELLPSDLLRIDPISAAVKEFLESDAAKVTDVIRAHPELLTAAADLRIGLLASMDQAHREQIEERRQFLKQLREASAGQSTPAEPVSDELAALLQQLKQPSSLADLPRRVNLIRRALALLEPGTNPPLEASLQISLGDLLMLDGRSSAIDEAIDGYMSAVKVLEHTRNSTAYATALTQLDKTSDPMLWAQGTDALGAAFADRIRGNRAANVDRAIELHRSVLSIRKRSEHPLEWAETQHNLGLSYQQRLNGDRDENIEKAILHFRRSLKVLSQSGNEVALSILIPRTHSNLSNAYARRGRGERGRNLELALRHGRLALRHTSRKTDPMAWASILSNLGLTYAERKTGDAEQNIKRSLRCFERALSVLGNETVPIGWAETKHQMAAAYMRRGDAKATELAIRAEQDALGVITEQTHPENWAGIMQNLGMCFAQRQQGDRAKNVKEAIASFNRALGVRRRDAFPREHLLTQRALGGLLFSQERWIEAARAYRGALAADRILMAGATSPESRQELIGAVGEIHDELAYACAKQGRLNEAILAAERGRARQLSDALQLEHAPVDRMRPADRRRYERSRDTIRRLQNAFRSSMPQPESATVFLKRAQALSRAQRTLDATIAAVRTYIPEFFEQSTLRQLHSAAAPLPAIYLIVTKSGGLALVARSRRIHALWLPRVKLGLLRERALQYFRSYAVWRASAGTDREAQVAWYAQLDILTASLWRPLIAPILNALNGARDAILITNGWMAMLPLQAAWKGRKAAPTGRVYAIDHVNFRQTPSLLAYGSARERGNAQVSQMIAVDEPQPVTGPPLTGSRYEILAAERRFPSPVVLSHNAATRTAALDALPRADVLHLSCHGFAEPENPLSSGLLMADGEILTVADLLNVRVEHCRLAILSACETGLTGTALPSEAVGLPTGFIQAGVAGVVGTLWSVAGESTALLVTRFYELWDPPNVHPNDALRQAQLWMRDTTNGEKAAHFAKQLNEGSRSGPSNEAIRALRRAVLLLAPNSCEHAHPYHWAGFSFTGA